LLCIIKAHDEDNIGIFWFHSECASLGIGWPVTILGRWREDETDWARHPVADPMGSAREKISLASLITGVSE
jgi:hypothetical protein